MSVDAGGPARDMQDVTSLMLPEMCFRLAVVPANDSRRALLMEAQLEALQALVATTMPLAPDRPTEAGTVPHSRP